MNNDIKELLHATTRKYFTVMSVISESPPNTTQTKKLIKQLDKLEPGSGLYATVTGTPVSNLEVLHTIGHILPWALLWIMVVTYIILLVLLRSVILPLKAIIMNLLSLSACYGVLVLVFQMGFLHHLLNFETQKILDVSLLVIIFCAVFGFSMDYEVFLLTRIREFYLKYQDNKKAIIFGIEKSGKIITSAAIIVIFLCGSFLVADVLMVKAFGLGIAIAIFIDAFLVRSMLVPATMRILSSWNWYLPKWLNKILPRI